MENETDEQFEERVLNKRAAQMFISVRARLQKQDSIQLSDMTYRNNRKQVNIRSPFPYSNGPFYKFYCIKYDFVHRFYFLQLFRIGGAKILFVVGIEEIPSVRNKTRHGIW